MNIAMLEVSSTPHLHPTPTPHRHQPTWLFPAPQNTNNPSPDWLNACKLPRHCRCPANAKTPQNAIASAGSFIAIPQAREPPPSLDRYQSRILIFFKSIRDMLPPRGIMTASRDMQQGIFYEPDYGMSGHNSTSNARSDSTTASRTRCPFSADANEGVP